MVLMGSAAAAAAYLSGRSGIVSIRQLRLAGVDSRWIRGQIGRGVWKEVFPGVLDTTGQTSNPQGRMAAACLAVGGICAVSHISGAGLYGLMALPAPTDLIHLSVPHGSHRIRVPGIVIHQDRHFEVANFVDGLPVVSVETVLIQLAGHLPLHDFRCVAAEAVSQHLVTIDGLMTGRPAPPSCAAVLAGVLEELQAGAISGGECAYWRGIKDRGWPLPELNVRVNIGEKYKIVDGLWRGYRLAYEIDGRSVHAHQEAFVADRRIHNALQSQGLLLMRFAVSEVFRHLEEVMSTTEAFMRLRARELGLPELFPRTRRRAVQLHNSSPANVIGAATRRRSD